MKTIVVYFSPTHTTKKVVNKIAEGINADEAVILDITTKGYENNNNFDSDDIIIFGVPVYGGRVPLPGLERIKKIKGTGQKAICVAVYGNNRIGDALKELAVTIKNNGFIPIAGAGFIGEHSFSNEEYKIAHGRPHENDLELAKEFGEKILESIDDLQDIEIKLPGEFPKGERKIIPPMRSIATDKCTECGRCIEVCPVGAIDDKLICESSKCIKCFACVKFCPENARELKDPLLEQFSQRLSKNEPKEPEFYI